MRSYLEYLWEFLKVVVISLAIIIPVRYFLIQPFFVRGASMEPNFDNGQYLVIDEISYRFDEPARGEVIVFRYPLDPAQYYIKRIIGLPGETVEIKDGNIYIFNGQIPGGAALDESAYLASDIVTHGNVRAVLGQREYFVLGDNRSSSSDSRQWGALPEGNIIGKVWLRAWPFNMATIF